MTRKMASKEEERVNTRCLILKTLLGLGEASKQKLHKELRREILARATLSKRVDELAEENIVRIEKGPRGPVGTHNCGLTSKGLVYLLLECNLESQEFEKTFEKLLRSEKLKELSSFANLVKAYDVAQVIAHSLTELRPKVNLMYFDEEWFAQLLKEIFEGVFLQRFVKMSKEKRASVGRDVDASIMRAKARDPRIKKDLLVLCDSKIKNAQAIIRQKKWLLKLYRKVRVYARNL